MASVYKDGTLQYTANNSSIPNTQVFVQAGVDPKTKKAVKADPPSRKVEFRKLLRIQDEQDAVNSFQWYNLPEGLTGEELERLLYYKGQLCFFYFKDLDRFYFMPYALDGSIDFYGRFNNIHPIPAYNGTTDIEKAQAQSQAQILSNIKLKVQHDIKYTDLTEQDIFDSTVILRDYTNQEGQMIIPRKQLQESIIDIESDIPCYLRTALKNSTGVVGVRVPDQSAYSNAIAANDAMDNAALKGDRLIPFISPIEM